MKILIILKKKSFLFTNQLFVKNSFYMTIKFKILLIQFIKMFL
jgi:hypothetical protein